MMDLNFADEKVADLFGQFEKGSTLFQPLDPHPYGTFNWDAPDELSEIASLLYAVKHSGPRFRLVSLGAAPGEWAIRAERGYRMIHPDGDYLSYCLEGDLDHVDMTRDFMTKNGADLSRNLILYNVVAHRDGWAYFPVINPEVDWGAGMAALSESKDDLDSNMTMSEAAKIDRIAANHGKPLAFRTVAARSLDSLFAETGLVDFLHSDIQGSEVTVFPNQMDAMNAHVRRCCIGTHGRQIERELIEVFIAHAWIDEGQHPCWAIGEGEHERLMKDGVSIWRNPRLT
jgi:hypothetical protein